ncbi:MAG: hypothetical protein M3552_12135 [Planctomycetota bacterium]|nr:hypothetical protein [Planctomycetaceae bacterium]MDQ3331384.1 hypothetical protein [Planctomycetota bacterium]
MFAVAPPKTNLDAIIAWIERHDVLLWWMAIGSAALAVGMLIATPWLVSVIPDDYFATKERPPIVGRSEHPVLRWLLRLGKNLLGFVLIIVGMLFSLPLIPGQGMIMALAGLMLLEFPGKRRMEMWIIRWGPLLRAINWFRATRGRPPLIVWSPESEARAIGHTPSEREISHR